MIKICLFYQINLIIPGSVSRDLLITGRPDLQTSISDLLTLPDLDLQLTGGQLPEFGNYYSQGNAAASRKVILPAVKKFVLNL